MNIVLTDGGELGFLFAKELFSEYEVFVIVQDPVRAKLFDEFDAKVDLKKYLLEAGFSNVTIQQATFGIVQIAIAEK